MNSSPDAKPHASDPDDSIAFVRDTLWHQTGAGIDALGNAIRACPDDLWGDRSRRPEFWYTAFHALFFLDLYVSGTLEGFAPPEPFTLDELDPAGVLPDRVYSRAELLAYYDYGRAKCRAAVEALTPDRARSRCVFPWVEMSYLELLLVTTRHTQHHAAQLGLLLRQTIDDTPGWVTRARD